MHHESDLTAQSCSTQGSPLRAFSAWSELERRWVVMTFQEHQAWLARPDLDPIEFATSEVAS
jgi:hypothetical protein